MPDEDQNTGTSTETGTSPEQSSSPSTEVQSAAPETSLLPDASSVEAPDFNQNNGDANQEGEATPGEKVSDALAAFQRANGNAPAKPVGHSGNQPYQKTGRDYSGLDENEVRLFKKMGDESFRILKPQYLEAKQLRAEHEKLRADMEMASKASFFEREDAYEVMPEYKHEMQNVAILDNEISHWQNQIAAIREGQDWVAIIGYDNTGRPQYSAPQKPTPQAEAQIVNAITQGHVYKSNCLSKVENLKSKFSNDYKGFVGKLKEVENNLFPGTDTKVLEQAMEKKLPLFPSYTHANPIVRSLAKALVVIDGLTMLLNEKKTANTTAALKNKTAAAAGPRGGTLAPGNTKPQTVGAAMDEFRRMRALEGF